MVSSNREKPIKNIYFTATSQDRDILQAFTVLLCNHFSLPGADKGCKFISEFIVLSQSITSRKYFYFAKL